MVGLSFQPTSGNLYLYRTTESMPLYHPERHGATFEKVFPAPFPNNITNVMLLTRRTVKSKQHYYTSTHMTENEKMRAGKIYDPFADNDFEELGK